MLETEEAKNDSLHMQCIKADNYRETLEAEVIETYKKMLDIKASATQTEKK